MIFANKSVSEVYQTTYKLLSAENDRGAVLLSGILTDAVLDEMIGKKLIPMPTNGKGRDDFQYARKIDMAYRLGLISEEMFNLLHALRNARNKFAHEVISTLDDVAVAKSIASVFSAMPELFAGFMNDWLKRLQGILISVGITDEELLNSVNPNDRNKFDNYMTVIIATLYKDSIKIEAIAAKSQEA
ncbi:DUF4145 domain-containing protein [Pseudomonas sp. MT3]